MATTTSPVSQVTTTPVSQVPDDHAPGYQFLAKLGKKVLRPGGVELTDKLLAELAITEDDDVVELAPGLGATTATILAANPRSYVGVDRDPVAAHEVPKMFEGPNRTFTRGSVSRTGLPDASCDVALGEAYLTMHPDSTKVRIVDELARIVRPGGRIGLHEVALKLGALELDEAATDVERTRITAELTNRFKVAFTPRLTADWITMLTDAGFEVADVHEAPLRLLEPERIIADEGVAGAARFAYNVLSDPQARKRIKVMRAAMHRNRSFLTAFALTATRLG